MSCILVNSSGNCCFWNIDPSGNIQYGKIELIFTFIQCVQLICNHKLHFKKNFLDPHDADLGIYTFLMNLVFYF